MWFTSDNAAPAHPSILAAISEANAGYAASYGADPLMKEVEAEIRRIFEAPEAAVYLVATGTAANSIALACLCPPWSTIYCHRHSHVQEDECGAPEFYTGGAKLTLLDGADGKITPEGLEAALASTGLVGVHNVQKGALSLTNTTEAGTVYSLEETAALTALARAHGCPVHLDGARFANALVALGCSPAEMTWRAGIDAVSFGGTKNGLLGVEAIILFDPARAWELELRRKRGAHLFSKHRYLSAQMKAYLEGDLWLDLAGRANASAAALSQGILQMDGSFLMHPADANAVFAGFPRKAHRAAEEAGAQYYLWPFDQTLNGPEEDPVTARLMCSWSTEPEDISSFLSTIRAA